MLLRTDMDALPVEEKTGPALREHRSRRRTTRARRVPVMHACGHDIHMTSLVGAATLLAKAKDRWRGTLVLVGQPAEEGGRRRDGACSKDGLFTRFPKPDFALALHDDPRLPAGTGRLHVRVRAARTCDSVDITIYGRGGHGSRARRTTVDPIVIAARIVLDLQTIVARENNPLDPAVVTVGSIHGGTKHNIIPDEVKLQLTVRSYKAEVRAQAARRDRADREGGGRGGGRAEGAARRDRSEGYAGDVQRPGADPAHRRRARRRPFGADERRRAAARSWRRGLRRVRPRGGVPVARCSGVGATPRREARGRARRRAHRSLLHSSEFAPDPEPTIKTGAAALTVAALELLGKPLSARSRPRSGRALDPAPISARPPAWAASSTTALPIGDTSVTVASLVVGRRASWSSPGARAARAAARRRAPPRANAPLGRRALRRSGASPATWSFSSARCVALQTLGIRATTLAAFGAALGVGIGFGLQDIVKNFVAGLILLIERPFQVGDRIEIDKVAGEVVEIRARATVLRTNDDVHLIVPNREFITRHGRQPQLRPAAVPLPRARRRRRTTRDPRAVEEALLEAARRCEGVLPDPPPSVRFARFGDSTLDFELLCWTRQDAPPAGRARQPAELRVHEALTRRGIGLPRSAIRVRTEPTRFRRAATHGGRHGSCTIRRNGGPP